MVWAQPRDLGCWSSKISLPLSHTPAQIHTTFHTLSWFPKVFIWAAKGSIRQQPQLTPRATSRESPAVSAHTLGLYERLSLSSASLSIVSIQIRAEAAEYALSSIISKAC